jgi:hypothetical protein
MSKSSRARKAALAMQVTREPELTPEQIESAQKALADRLALLATRSVLLRDRYRRAHGITKAAALKSPPSLFSVVAWELTQRGRILAADWVIRRQGLKEIAQTLSRDDVEQAAILDLLDHDESADIERVCVAVVDNRLADTAFGRAPAQRWQHGSEPEERAAVGDDETLIRAEIVGNTASVLRAKGLVSDAEVAAASRWLRDYERAHKSRYVHPATAGIRGGGGSTGPDDVIIFGLDASSRVLAVRTALGAEAAGLLVDVAYYRLGISELQRRANRGISESAPGWASRSAVESRVAAVLLALSSHFQRVDRVSRNGLPSSVQQAA